MLIIRERLKASDIDEREVARRWWTLPLHSLLPVNSGETYELLYAGRPGGSMGPDVHDAVLRDRGTDQQLIGDVEFHTASSEWRQHQHASDPRYNQVILHIVLICNDLHPTMRQDGSVIPVCSLHDVSAITTLPLTPSTVWPCQQRIPHLSEQERNKLLHDAGMARFEQKAELFLEQLHAEHYEHCLFVALAESLAYGRDRAFFRATALALLGQSTVIPEPLGRAYAPSPLDAQRLHVLRILSHLMPQLWSALYIRFFANTTSATLDLLREFFVTRGLSLARTEIVLCNVVLPYTLAMAWLKQDTLLAERARELYLVHPGLSSNTITRLMTQQLGLAREPRGSCQQQGLHHIYQQTCREKRCTLCIAGRDIL